MARASLADVARMAGVSASTASLALRTEHRVAADTRARVLDAAHKLHYVPDEISRSMRYGRTNAVGVVIPQTTEHIFSHPYFTEVLGGIAEVVVAAGYTITLSLSAHDESADAYRRVLESRRADGVILLAAPMDDVNALRLAASGLPTVFLGEWSNQPTVHSVSIDDRGGALAVVTHLLEQGYTRIAHLTGKPGHASALAREQGYRAALAAAGRVPAPELVAPGDFSAESGRAAMLAVLDSGACPDAVFAASDEMAIGALQTLQQRGLRVPEQIAVAGFDDIGLASVMNPPLTSVHHPMREMGHAAAELLLGQINGDLQHPVRRVFATHVVVRASTVRTTTP